MQTWKPNYQEFRELFGNDYCLMILLTIYQQNQINYFPCSADISRILDIHISTITKYLELLSKYKLVKGEQNLNKPGKPTFYQTIVTNLTIILDIPFCVQNIGELLDKNTLPNPLIRENPNLYPRVMYIFKDDGTIQGFVIKQKTKAKRIIKRKISLSLFESQFMKYLPHPTMQYQHFHDICYNAGINDFSTIKRLHSFVEKLKKYRIIEEKHNKGVKSE